MADNNPYEFRQEAGQGQTQGQQPVILPPQVIEKPTSVTVFGILNCVFGGLGLLCMPVSIFGMIMAHKTMEMVPAYEVFVFATIVIRFGFAGWLVTLGIGLLMFKRWARRGTVIYAGVVIVWGIIEVVISILSPALGWITVPEQGMPGYIGGTCGGVIGLVYPVLLLIFMQSPKVKQAFAAIGG